MNSGLTLRSEVEIGPNVFYWRLSAGVLNFSAFENAHLLQCPLELETELKQTILLAYHAPKLQLAATAHHVTMDTACRLSYLRFYEP